MNEITQYQQNTIVAPTDGVGAMVQTGRETAASVLAAAAKAETEARLVMAMKRPRNLETVRIKMKNACKRPGFAGSATENTYGAAWYNRPISKNDSIQGFSVRFAEECMRNMGNMDAKSSILYDDPDKRIINVNVLDMENNISVSQNVEIEKVVERRFLKDGEVAISQRQNSYGKVVFKRRATEDEVIPIQNSAVSKTLRNLILRLVPGDIQAECRETIQSIRQGAIVKDPAAAKRKIIDAYNEIGVIPDDLRDFLEHSVDKCSPAEIEMLREMFKAIKDGKTTFHAELQQLKIERGDIEEPEKPKSKMEKAAEKSKKKSYKKEDKNEGDLGYGS